MSDDAGIRDAEAGDAFAIDADPVEPNCWLRLEKDSRLKVDGPVDAFEDDFTIDLWMKVERLEGVQNVVAVDSSDAHLTLEYDSATAACSLRRGNTTWRASQSLGSAWAGSWHHVACTRNRDELALWLDGFKVSITDDPERVGSPATLLLGAVPDGARSFEGELDDFRFTPAVRYRNDFTPERPEISSYDEGMFHFDECWGRSVVDAYAQTELQFEGPVNWMP